MNSSDVSVTQTIVRLSDRAGLDKVLATMPNKGPLRKQLLKDEPGTSSTYHPLTRTYYSIASDGQTLMCFTVRPVSGSQAAAIDTELQSVEEWGVKSFLEAVHRALGGTLTHVV